MIKNLILLAILFSQGVAAGKPFFCEKAAYKEKGFLYVVGEVLSESPQAARSESIKVALEEASLFLPGAEFQGVVTQRYYAYEKDGMYGACRLIKIPLIIKQMIKPKIYHRVLEYKRKEHSGFWGFFSEAYCDFSDKWWPSEKIKTCYYQE